MKTKLFIFIFFIFILSGLYSKKAQEPYYWESISTPNKTLNFSIIVFHQDYEWTESKTDGNYSTITLSVKNKNKDKQLEWKNYTIYLQLKDNTLLHNYKTVAKTGRFANNYKVEPDKIRYQNLCYAKKFNPDDIKRVYIKMTAGNFIILRYFKGEKAEPNEEKQETGLMSNELDPEAKVLLLKFLEPGADHSALTNTLKPTEADYKAFFTNDSWKTAMDKYNELWEKYPFAIKPNEGQTELLLWGSNIEDIKFGTGNAMKFPGGYKMIVDRIESGHIIYRFKFVKPGKSIGMSFDGLVKVNGRWVIFPKPWRVFQK